MISPVHIVFLIAGVVIGIQGVVKIKRQKVLLKDSFWLYNPIDRIFLKLFFDSKQVTGARAIFIGILHIILFVIWSYYPLTHIHVLLGK
jgi:hypothetical protein